MLFNSIEFFIFLLIVFILYWFAFRNHIKYQNIFLLVISYIFYGWWDWRFLSLIIISSFVDYFIGQKIYQTKKQRKRTFFLVSSLFVNLGLLGFFKYYNFFIDSFIELFYQLGFSLNKSTLKIILPVGISFYTFQTLSYTLDIYFRKIKPTKNIIVFFAFVSFFPQLVAGPIERAKNLLPQFEKKRTFDYDKAINGIRQIVWGLFKKIVIADIAGINVDIIFSNYNSLSGSILLVGAILFAFQIYCDFSGYSDIAIGTAKLLGFDLKTNFAYPYFSRNLREFWQKWHISLSSWFRDYVYIPLGGNKSTKVIHVRNLLITFIISGFWHGANWTFISWGLIHGIFYSISILYRNQEKINIHQRKLTIREGLQILSVFSFTTLTWIFFRAENISDAILYLRKIFTKSLFSFPAQEIITSLSGLALIQAFFFIVVLIVAEWIQRKKEHVLEISKVPRIIRWIIYYSLILCILYFFNTERSFIYFQF